MRTTGWIALVVALVASPQLAHGQTPGADNRPRTSIRSELTGKALDAWNAAAILYEAGDYGGARVQYWQAWELSSNPRVLFNVGVCDKNLRHYARAVSTWRMQLRVGEGKLQPGDVTAIQGAIEAVVPFVTSMKVKIDTPNATLFIDGLKAGESPFVAPVEIDVGQHRILVRKEGYRDYYTDVTVARNEVASLNVKLEPLVRTSLVTVNVTSPQGATVMIDGVDMGPAPFKGQVAVGRHTIEARAPGYTTARQTSDVSSVDPLTVSFSLGRERRSGELRVKVSEADATISIDGKIMGAGDWAGIVASGGHQLVVKKPGFRTYSTEIAMNDDQVRTITVPLAREERGPAWVWWTVGSAAIFATGAVATYFIARPPESTPVAGSWGSTSVPLGGTGK